MIRYLCGMIHKGHTEGWTLLQRGGGAYRDCQLVASDATGVVVRHQGITHLVPWTSINELQK